MFGNRLLMHVHLYSGFPAVGTPRPSPPPSVCTWRKSVSESASGTWSRMVAWEQISCPCVYLVLTVHTGLFFHCSWAYQHTVSLLRGLYLPASELKKVENYWIQDMALKKMLIEPMSKFALSHYGIREEIQLINSSDSAGILMCERWIKWHWGAEGSVCIMMC